MSIPRPGPGLPSVWRNRDFRLLWSGQIVSALGSQASGLAFPLLLLSITHSAAETGLLIAVRDLPNIVLPLPVGVLVERWVRKKLMILAELGRGVALDSIPVALATGHLSLLQAFGGVATILMVFVPQVILAALAMLNPHLRCSGPARADS